MTEIELCIMWAHRAQSVAEQPQLVRFYELCETALRAQQEQPNEPLTYEQLRQMEGEPVWCKKEMAYVFVSTLIDKPYKEIYYFTNRGMCKTALLHHAEFYRRKPEQEE